MIYFGDFAAGTVPWVPTDLGSTLQFWGDPNQQSEAADAEVTSFIDRSGNGFNFNKVTANGPPLRHSFVNGKKALQSGGSAGVVHLRAASAGSLLGSATSASMYIVLKGDADPSSSPGDEFPVNNMGTGGASHLYTDGNWYESFATTLRRSVNPPTAWTSWRIAAVESASGLFKMYWDGTAIVSEASNTVNTAGGGGGTRDLFNRNGSTSNDGNYAGYIGDLIFCDSVLSTGNRQKVEGYLAHKYGLTGNLPGGHPYIGSPP